MESAKNRRRAIKRPVKPPKPKESPPLKVKIKSKQLSRVVVQTFPW
jgi:hypothetical protein